jgi:hypothetical protein
MMKLNTRQHPYHLEEQPALLNLLVPGELLRHGVADAGEAPRRDHLHQPVKPTQFKNSPSSERENKTPEQERKMGPLCEAGAAGAGAGTASTPCTPATPPPSLLLLSLLPVPLLPLLPWRPASDPYRTAPIDLPTYSSSDTRAPRTRPLYARLLSFQGGGGFRDARVVGSASRREGGIAWEVIPEPCAGGSAGGCRRGPSPAGRCTWWPTCGPEAVNSL